jgi:preprotein translocase subunit SecB
MSEENQEATNEQAQGQFNLQRVYCKDISFETPNSPTSFLEEWKPDMNLNLNTQVQALGEDTYEVVLVVTVTVKNNDKTAFLAEVHQAGIFQIAGIPEEQKNPVMGITCPNILFPFAREVVADLVNRGSFPQLLLSPVNFEQLYAQHMQQVQHAQEQAEGEAKH